MNALDIIIPVYNEGGKIVEVLEALRHAVKTPFRVLIGYDHSNDTTLEALRSYESGSLEITLIKNRRRGAHGAVLTAFEVSTAPAVLVFPADDTFNAGIVDSLVERLQGGCDIVVPSRFIPGGRMEGAPWFKTVLVRAASFTLYHGARLPVHDATNGFRLFSRRVIDSVKIESSLGFTFSLELMVKCHRLGWNIEEVPASWFERTSGQSRFRALKWLPAYLRWYAYAFATTYLRRGPETVFIKSH